MIVLDASALLAFLFREPGGDRVAAVIEDACISAVNLSEVLGRFARDGHEPDAVFDRLAATSLEIAPFGPEDALIAASLEPITRPLGLSLGDRACLALAQSRKAVALTADRTWLKLKAGVRIECVR